MLAGGEVPSSPWVRDSGGEKHILHIHGPKLDKVKCIFDFMDQYSPGSTSAWMEESKSAALQHCGIAHHQAQAMISILEAAYAADGGALYRTTQVLYADLLRQANVLIDGEARS